MTVATDDPSLPRRDHASRDASVVLENAPVGLVALDARGHVVEANRAARLLLERASFDYRRTPAPEWFAANSPESVRSVLQGAARERTVRLSLNARERPIEVSVRCVPVGETDGSAHCVVLIDHVPAATETDSDTTRLAAARQQLLDAMPNVVFRMDPESGATLFVNAAAERLIGVAPTELLGVPGLDRWLVDDGERVAMSDARRSVAAGIVAEWTDRAFLNRDGRRLMLRTRLYPVQEVAAGATVRTVVEGIAQDVTEEFESRRQLVQADRLASLGLLAAGVAHEINNPAAFIALGVQQLGRLLAQLPADGIPVSIRGRVDEILDELSDGIQRIAQIVGELKLFSRIPEGAYATPVDVNRLIVSAVTLARSEIRYRAKLDLEFGDLPLLVGDHARLGQVFVNLLINAAQAIAPGNPEANTVRVRTRLVDGYVEIEVSDTGAGIPETYRGRIFDPFFTTKAPGEGTGLGLSISYDLVRRSGGTLSVESEVGRGTTFVIRLPATDSPGQRTSRTRVTSPPHTGRILVVEDEHHLAMAVSRGLASHYAVDVAPDAVAALARIERGAGLQYDVVLCDLRLPGMDGRALYEAVGERRPEQAARFVFVTGASASREFESFVRSTDRPVIEKPFAIGEIEDAVEDLLHRHAASAAQQSV